MTPTTTIPERMRASVLTAPLTLSIEDVPTPPMESDEVLVEVAAVGVCGSDTHYYRHGRIGDFVVTSPLILGHELSGRIVAVGEEVPESRIGERVAIEPQKNCRRCRECRAGHYNLCPNMEFYATPPIDGAFAAVLRDSYRIRAPHTGLHVRRGCGAARAALGCCDDDAQGSGDTRVEHTDRRRRANRDHLCAGRARLRRRGDHRHRSGGGAAGAGTELRRHPRTRSA